MLFPVVVHQEGDSAYGVTVPDMPGCFSAGDTMEEALSNTVEAVDFHCEGLADDGLDIPGPGDLSEHMKNPDYAGGVWVMVDVDVSKYLGKAQRINITLPHRLITKIDKFVAEHKEYRDRSKFLADASMKLLHQ